MSQYQLFYGEVQALITSALRSLDRLSGLLDIDTSGPQLQHIAKAIETMDSVACKLLNEVEEDERKVDPHVSYRKYFAGTEVFAICGESERYEVYSFPTQEMLDTFLREVGGMPHPPHHYGLLGGRSFRAIKSME